MYGLFVKTYIIFLRVWEGGISFRTGLWDERDKTVIKETSLVY